MAKIQSIKIKDEGHIFKDLEINLGNKPKKIIALVGPNGCGKSSIFDFFEGYHQAKLGKQGIIFPDTFMEMLSMNIKAITTSNINFHGVINNGKKTFYIRSPYRCVPDLNISTLSAVPDVIDDRDRPGNTRLTDKRLLNNFSLLQGNIISELKTGERERKMVEREFIYGFNEHIRNILDVQIYDLGNIPLSRGQLYFKRGEDSSEIPFNFLSSGEKEVIDIVLDLVIKVETYNETIFCIDEPELHINTSIQKLLLLEIDKIIPDNCQLWIATHSVGFLRAMQEELNEKSQIIDFGKFPIPGTRLEPIEKNNTSWRKLFHVAIDDLATPVAPKILIYCEGNRNNRDRSDACVYNTIFNSTQPNALFINAGGSDEMEKYRSVTLDILRSNVFPSSELYVLKDMDDRGESQRELELNQDENMRILKRREIENYLFDWNVVVKAYPNINRDEYNRVFGGIDTITGDMDSKFGSLKDLCEEHSKKDFIENLAKKINQIDNPEIFDELNEIIFKNSSNS